MIRFLVVLILLTLLLPPAQAGLGTCDVGVTAIDGACADVVQIGTGCSAADQSSRGAAAECGPDLCAGAVVAVTGAAVPAVPALGASPAMPVAMYPPHPVPSRILRPPIVGML